jgi:hypothetical protein
MGDKPAVLPVATLADIRAAADIGDETIPVPQWGHSVRVRGLSRGEVKQCLEMDDRTIGYLHFGLVEPAVTLEEAAEIDAKSFQAVQVILEAIVRLAGLGAGFREGTAEGPGVRSSG